jgi:hypothetical protein
VEIGSMTADLKVAIYPFPFVFVDINIEDFSRKILTIKCVG